MAHRRDRGRLSTGLARREQRGRLATPPRPWPTLALGMAELLLTNVGQDSIQTLVLHHRTLLDLPDLVEDPVGQVETLVPDRETAIRIVEDLHPLPGDLAGHLIRNCSRPAGAMGYGRGLKRVLALKG